MTAGAETDVLIIGAGASGAAVAWRLAEAGIKVACLELGGWVRPEETITADDHAAGSPRRACSSAPASAAAPRPCARADSRWLLAGFSNSTSEAAAQASRRVKFLT